jgi:hypothetical protein
VALAADTMHGVTIGNSPVMPTPIFSQQQPCLQAAAFKSSSGQRNASSLVRSRPSCHSFILNLCVRRVVWCVLGEAARDYFLPAKHAFEINKSAC